MPDGIRRKGGLQPVAPQTPKTGAPGSDVGRRQKRQGVTPELRTGLRDGARRGESLIRPSGPKPTDTNVDVMIAELAQLDLSSLRPQPGQPRPRRRLSGAAWSALLTDERFDSAIAARLGPELEGKGLGAQVQVMADVSRYLRPAGAQQVPFIADRVESAIEEVEAKPHDGSGRALQMRWAQLARLRYLTGRADETTKFVKGVALDDLAGKPAAEKLDVVRSIRQDGVLGPLKKALNTERNQWAAEVAAEELAATLSSASPAQRVDALLAELADDARPKAAIVAELEAAVEARAEAPPHPPVVTRRTQNHPSHPPNIDHDGAVRIGFVDRAVPQLPADDRYRAVAAMAKQLSGCFAVTGHLRTTLTTLPKPNRALGML